MTKERRLGQLSSFKDDGWEAVTLARRAKGEIGLAFAIGGS